MMTLRQNPGRACRLAIAAGALCAAFAVSAVSAQTVRSTETRLVFLGADADEGLPGPVTGSLGVLSFADLPTGEAAGSDVLAALLQANAVSTFVSGAGADEARTGDLHLVVDLTLAEANGAVTAAIADEALSLADFATRLSALATALRAQTRQVAYVRLADPDDLFPRALPDLRAAIDDLGFAVAVLMVDRDGSCGADDTARPPLHYETLAGVPDRAPFGSGDDTVTVGEAASYVSDVLARGAARDLPCAADYSLILTAADADAPVVRVPPQPLIPALDEAVYLESFEALFLMSSDDATAIGAFLAACRYCPSAQGLLGVQGDIGAQARARALETEVWENIRDDENPGRIAIYLENCQLCAFREAAQARLATLDVAEDARDAERVELAALMASDDLDGMLRWLATCAACEDRETVEARVAALEADGRFEAEAKALEEAVLRQNAVEIADWLAACVLCALQDEAEAELAAIEAETAAAAACVAAAGLPQLGGPRLLSDIDPERAGAVCDAVLAEFPGSALAATVRGRIALSVGDAEAAEAGYAVGLAAGLPQAYGLAAHNLYAPLEDEPDFEAADALARQGYAAGDWFSGEVLVVLYSRELVPGRTASDAFQIALADAEEGNPVAQFFTGFFLDTGTGTTPSGPEAVAWYEASVAQGYTHAAPFLAQIYEDGTEGVAADPGRAARLYLDAVAEGDETAHDRLTTQIRDRPRDVVAALQTELRTAGVFTSLVDGIPGPATARAVEAYIDLYSDAGQ